MWRTVESCFGSSSSTTSGFSKAPINKKTKLPDTFPTPLTTPCTPLFMAKTAHAPAATANAMLERPRNFATDFPPPCPPKEKAANQHSTSNTMATMTRAALAFPSVAALYSLSKSLELGNPASVSFQTERTLFTIFSFSASFRGPSTPSASPLRKDFSTTSRTF